MLLRTFTLAAALLGAAPVFAGEAPVASMAPSASTPAPAPAVSSSAPAVSSVAPATSAPPGAPGKTCAACGAPGGGGTCAASQPGMASQMSEEEWKEFIRKKFEEQQKDVPEPADPDPFAFSAYQGERPEPMGEQTIINGAKMEIATLIVPDSINEVEQTYYEAFTRMGFRPMTGDVPKAPGLRYLSFRPRGSKNLKTVTLVPNGTGTVILASVGNPEDLLVKKPELPGGLPVPPNAEAASSIQQVEPGNSTQSSFFLVHDSTPEKVLEFYHRELAARGFSPLKDGPRTDSESFEKDGMMLTLSAKPHTDPNTVAVSLVWLQ